MKRTLLIASIIIRSTTMCMEVDFADVDNEFTHLFDHEIDTAHTINYNSEHTEQTLAILALPVKVGLEWLLIEYTSQQSLEKPSLENFEYFDDTEIDWQEIDLRSYSLECPVANCTNVLNRTTKRQLKKNYIAAIKAHTELKNEHSKLLLNNFDMYVSSKYNQNVVGKCPLENCFYVTKLSYDYKDPFVHVKNHIAFKHKKDVAIYEPKDLVKIIKKNKFEY